MIIHEPVLTRAGGRTRVAATLEASNGALIGAGPIWFEADDAAGIPLSTRADPFLVAAVPLAMATGEDLEVRGEVSPRLLHGLQQFQIIHNAWWPELRVASIACPSLSHAPDRASGVATSFSGGVDSLYTLRRHAAGRETVPGFAITHALLVNGFDLDVDLEDSGRFGALRRIYEPLLTPLGVRLLEMRTNLKTHRVAAIGLHRVVRSFATAVAAVAMTASPAIGRFYMAGAFGYRDQYPDGSHALTDHLLSTEGFETIHDGADAPTRVDKVAALASWPEAMARLRVCSNPEWRNVDYESATVVNCGRCDKCVRTMIALALLGYETMPPVFLEQLTRKKINAFGRGNAFWVQQSLREAERRGRRDIATPLRIGLLEHKVPAPIRGLIRSVRRRLRR